MPNEWGRKARSDHRLSSGKGSIWTESYCTVSTTSLWMSKHTLAVRIQKMNSLEWKASHLHHIIPRVVWKKMFCSRKQCFELLCIICIHNKEESKPINGFSKSFREPVPYRRDKNKLFTSCLLISKSWRCAERELHWVSLGKNNKSAYIRKCKITEPAKSIYSAYLWERCLLCAEWFLGLHLALNWTLRG